MSNLYLLNFTTLWRLSRSVMGWLQLNSWSQIFTLISKGELHGILLGMITWLVVQLKLEKEQRHWHPLTVLFEDWDIAQSGTELRTRVIGKGGREEGGREEGALTHLERKGTPVVYLPGLKCCISFNCCKHTFFINKSLNQTDDSVSS